MAVTLHATLLAGSPLFDGLDNEALRTIAATLVTETWPAGQQIIGPKETVRSFRIVVAGRVKITVSSPADGRELTLWLLGPGDGFDIVSLLDGKSHAICAWALDDVQTLAAPMTQWRGWLERFRPLRVAVLRYVASRMRDITVLAADLAFHDTPTRLAHLLLRLFEARQGDLLHGLPQRELAAMIGSVRIVVSRVLGQLRRRAEEGPSSIGLPMRHLEPWMRRAPTRAARRRSARSKVTIRRISKRQGGFTRK